MNKKCPKKKPIGLKYWYSGSLSLNRMDNKSKKAYTVYRHMKERCYRPEHDAYKYYGEKGIKITMYPREFIAWWLEQQSILKLEKPSVSRIDHSGNYEIKNIKLEEMSENIKEMNSRFKERPNSYKKVSCFDYKTMNLICNFNSIKEAALKTGIDRSMISKLLSGCFMQSKGFTFKYLKELHATG